VPYALIIIGHSRVLRSSVAPYLGTGTADQADLVNLGSAQLNLMSIHLTLVWQLPTIEHKIDRHGGRLWKRQRPLDKPHDDDDDDDVGPPSKIDISIFTPTN